MTSEHVKKVLVGMGIILAVSILITFAFGRTAPTSTTPTAPIMPIADVPDEPAVPEPMSPPDDGVMCTMDAKICPDGSAVGRSGPNCEFAPCPEAPIGDGKVVAYPGLGIEFRHDDSVSVNEDAPDQVRVWKWGPTQSGQTELYDGMIVTFRLIQTPDTPEKYALEKIRELEGIGKVTAPLSDRVFAGREAKTYSASALGDFTVIVIPTKTNQLLEITTMAPDPTGVGFQGEVERLLSTVIFTS